MYTYTGLADPTTIADASVFNYIDSSTKTAPSPYGPSFAAWAQEGDTVFFRRVDGYYGAWYIEDIYFDSTNPVDFAALNGTWYFLDDGSADFSLEENGNGTEPNGKKAMPFIPLLLLDD